MRPSRPTFLYDSDCGVCTRLRDAVSLIDSSHRVDFLPIDRAAETGLLDSIPYDRRHDCSRMVRPDGSITAGGEAMLDLLALLPGGRVPSALISRAPFGLRSAHFIYGVVSRLHGSSCLSSHTTAYSSRLSVAWSSR